jgi:hypothetical protein
MSRLDTVQHEAAHCVFALAHGHRVAMARVGDRGDGFLGSVEIEEVADIYGHLITTLAGPMATGQSPPQWAPDPAAAASTDEREAAMCVHVGGFTRTQYLAAGAIAAHLLDDPNVKGAIASVGDRLARLGSLTNIGVKDAVGEPFLRWIESGT